MHDERSLEDQALYELYRTHDLWARLLPEDSAMVGPLGRAANRLELSLLQNGAWDEDC